MIMDIRAEAAKYDELNLELPDGVSFFVCRQ